MTQLPEKLLFVLPFQEEEGWWEGTNNGKLGMFPSNFVEEFTDEIPEEKGKSGVWKYHARLV